ncbi:MAG TPA: SAM-dependent methyltransferase [Bryobacteraceae bacterium]|jgi:SAM-dependent MidA family methyltransferase|nr:SAM-dependent methyltransferase [Bryobacteraceae bacterium]
MHPRIAFCKLLGALAIASSLSISLLTPVFAGDRQLVNGWDVRDEIKLAPGVDPAAVKDYFPSFYDYLDTVLFHPTAGYYSSGRVNFSSDYQTFPIALYPSFGQMITEHMFQMWDGMRKAGTLAPGDKFTIAEFGAGDGAMAESVLEYIDQQAASSPDPRWKQFRDQTVYACYDRSPALSAKQRKRNTRFGARFDARLGDATDPGATIAKESLKGVILSNELPDCFSVHKVILGMDGKAELAYTVPSISTANWAHVEAALPAAAKQTILKDDRAIREKLFGGKAPGADRFYLSKAGFSALLDAFSGSANYEVKVNLLQFQEVYVPVSVVPELAEHLRQYAHSYAYALSKSGKGMVTYINLGEGKFIHGAGTALKAGYVITIDYGSNWDGILAQEFDHLRMYGQGSSSSQANPYHAPTLNDMTTDVNFSHLAEEGRTVGLESLYFGPQHWLQLGTPIDLDKAPAVRMLTSADQSEFQNWAGLFYSWEVYKILVQRKEKTDSAYQYSSEFGESLAVADESLSASEKATMADLEKKLGR